MRTVISPTTGLGERQRQTESGMNGFPGGLEGIRQTYGQITVIHPNKRFIKVADEDGMPLSNGRWIPLMHTPKEINSIYGTVRTGMFVLVSFSGADGGWANARIIGEENEKIDSPNQDNEMSVSSWRIFQ